MSVEPATERLRLFYALWPDESTRAALVAATAPPLAGLPGRAVPAANLHLTLAFLHSVPRARLADLLALGASLAAPALTLVLDRWGWFERPRVLWLGPSVLPPALAEFERSLWEALAPLGFGREHARFRPHVTLRRKAEGLPPRPPVPVVWELRAWALVASQPAPGGSVYRPLALWPTQGRFGPETADSAAAGPPDS